MGTKRTQGSGSTPSMACGPAESASDDCSFKLRKPGGQIAKSLPVRKIEQEGLPIYSGVAAAALTGIVVLPEELKAVATRGVVCQGPRGSLGSDASDGCDSTFVV